MTQNSTAANPRPPQKRYKVVPKRTLKAMWLRFYRGLDDARYIAHIINKLLKALVVCLILVAASYFYKSYYDNITKALQLAIAQNLQTQQMPSNQTQPNSSVTNPSVTSIPFSSSSQLRNDVTYAGMYGRLGGWGSLGLVGSGEAAVNKTLAYAREIDKWNGSLGVIPVVNLANRQTNTVQKLAAIQYCQKIGCYVMLDISPVENVKNIISTYTIAPNVWFDLDLEHNGKTKVNTQTLNSYVSYYASLRQSKGFKGPGVFGFYDFKSHITVPSAVTWQQGSVTVVPIFDGFASKSGKWSSTQTHYSRFSGAPAFGIMEFITRWGSKYDSGFTPTQYYQAFQPKFFIAQ